MRFEQWTIKDDKGVEETVSVTIQPGEVVVVSYPLMRDILARLGFEKVTK